MYPFNEFGLTNKKFFCIVILIYMGIVCAS
jgi:hypothetical protein